MLTLSREKLNTIERQMYNKARDIDVAIYNSLFDESSKDFVLDCLMLYRNRDGGFGNALQIDNYNPNTSVYQIYEAFRILDMLDFNSKYENELYEDLVNKACNYLYNRAELNDSKFNPLVASNNDFAHSLEFEYNPQSIEKFGYHPTPALIGFTLTLVNPSKAYYKKALKMLDKVLAYFTAKEVLDDYDFESYSSLLGSLKKADLAVEAQNILNEKLVQQALEHKEDPDFSFAKYLRNCVVPKDLENLISSDLDKIIGKLKIHGLWENEKKWLTEDRYPEADSAMIKWLGCQSVNNLWLLNHYERIEK